MTLSIFNHEEKSLDGGDVEFETGITNERSRKLNCGGKSWLWLATTKKVDYLSIFPSN